MKKLVLLTIALFMVVSYLSLQAQTKTNPVKTPAQHCKNFVDKNNDGYNDNAPDSDGDGIPNCIDSDYKCSKMQKGEKCQADMKKNGMKENAAKHNGKGNKKGCAASCAENKDAGKKNG